MSNAYNDGSLMRPRALVADDNPMTFELFAAVIESCGWDVDVAQDGFEALTKIHNETFDLVLLDLHMPGLDGIEALQRLQAEPPAAPLPRIVVVTADLVYGVRSDLTALGVDSVLFKPIDLAALAEIVASTPMGAAAAAV